MSTENKESNSSAAALDTHPPSKNRKGLGAKQRQVEKFRLRKNEATHEEMHEANTRLRDSFCKFDNLEDLLSSLRAGETLTPPPAEVEIRVDEDLAATTVSYLRTQKVEVYETDVALLNEVTRMQVYSKVQHSRRSSPFDEAATGDTLVEMVDRHFKSGLKSMALLVDQVGQFELQGKQIYPKVAYTLGTPVPDGYVATPLRMGTQRLYLRSIPGQPIEDVAADPGIIGRIPVDRQLWTDTDPMINVTSLVKRYADFIHRIERKMAHAITEIDLLSGKGSPTQIVGCCDEVRYSDGERLAWCNFQVSQTVMQLGAGFGFGYNSTHAFHAYNSCHIATQTRVDTTSFGNKLMRLNAKVARSEAR